MLTKKAKFFSLLILIITLTAFMTGCDLFDGEDTPEIDIEMIAEEISSKPIDYLNLRESEMKFTVQEGLQEGAISFTAELQFEPIALVDGEIVDKVEFNNGEVELDIITYAEDEKFMVTVETPAGEEIEQFSITLENVEPIMALDSDAESLDEEGSFNLDVPRFGFFMAPNFESTDYTEVNHNYYSFYSASAFLDLGLDELTAVAAHMLENSENSFFVDAQAEGGYSSFADFREYGSNNLQNDIDEMSDFYYLAGLVKVGNVGDEYPTYTKDDYTVEITEIEGIEDKELYYGTDEETAIARLPKQITGVSKEGISVKLDVEWQENDEYDPKMPGEYKYIGKLKSAAENDWEVVIPNEFAEIQVKLILNEKQELPESEDVYIEENEEVVIERDVLYEKESSLSDKLLEVQAVTGAERSEVVLEFSETPDAILYRAKGNNIFEYTNFYEIEEGKIKLELKHSEAEILPIIRESDDHIKTLDRTDKHLEIIDIAGGSLNAKVKNISNAEAYFKIKTSKKNDNEIDDKADEIADDFDSNYITHLNDDNIININGLDNGRYTLVLLEEERSPLDKALNRFDWKQDVFINDPGKNEDEIRDLAERFAPILFFHRDEEYFPISVEEIFAVHHPSDVKINSSFDIDSGVLNDLLTYNANRDSTLRNEDYSLLKSKTGNISMITIYYSLIERNGNHYLNYHFLYAYDPKSPQTDSNAAHIFDRESFTIVLDSNMEPERVVYGAHLAGQRMSVWDNDNFPHWMSGRVSVDWDSSLRVGRHPIISIAEGSHAIFPVPEFYEFVNYDIPITERRRWSDEAAEMIFTGWEFAGDWPKDSSDDKWNNNIAYPDKLNTIGRAQYQLENLLDESFKRGESPLQFSGKAVPIANNSIPYLNINWYLGGSYFPPFTQREVDPESYTQETISSQSQIAAFADFDITYDNLLASRTRHDERFDNIFGKLWTGDIIREDVSQIQIVKYLLSELSNPINKNIISDENNVALSWDYIVRADGYEIYRREVEDDNSFEVIDTIEHLDYLDSTVKEGQEYEYQVVPFIELDGYYSDNRNDYIRAEDKEIFGTITIPEEEPSEEYTLTMETKGQGSTDPEEGSHTYNEGVAVNISAVPKEGWEFSHWEGDVADADSAETTITMDENKVVTAYFIEKIENLEKISKDFLDVYEETYNEGTEALRPYLAPTIIHLGEEYTKDEYMDNLKYTAEDPEYSVALEYKNHRIESDKIIIESHAEWQRPEGYLEGTVEFYLEKIEGVWKMYKYDQIEVFSKSNLFNLQIKDDILNVFSY